MRRCHGRERLQAPFGVIEDSACARRIEEFPSSSPPLGRRGLLNGQVSGRDQVESIPFFDDGIRLPADGTVDIPFVPRTGRPSVVGTAPVDFDRALPAFALPSIDFAAICTHLLPPLP